MSHLDDSGKPIFCYVTDRRSLLAMADPPPAGSAAATALLLQRVEAAASAGVDWIQVREKDLSARELSEIVVLALDRLRRKNLATRIIVNDRLDVALAAGAHGVHLGENSLPVAEALRLRDAFFVRYPRRDFLIGASCHSLHAAQDATRAGTDYLFFGPVFDTPSKAVYGPPQGLELLASLCSRVQVPVLAIGGITSANFRDCLAAGAAGVAAIRLFQSRSSLAFRRPAPSRVGHS